MNTPVRSLRPDQRRKFTAEEKQQLLKNLELEGVCCLSNISDNAN